MASVLKQIEGSAAAGDFVACRASLGNLTAELRKFSSETATV
jgi:hypothetical protein